MAVAGAGVGPGRERGLHVVGAARHDAQADDVDQQPLARLAHGARQSACVERGDAAGELLGDRLAALRHGAAAGAHAAARAASSVFLSRQATVIGPTPPGTGVIAPRHLGGLREGHVADQPALAVRRRHALDADVDDDGARLDPVAPAPSPAGRPPPPPGRRGAPRRADRACASGRSSRCSSRRAAAAPSACRRCWSGR